MRVVQRLGSVGTDTQDRYAAGAVYDGFMLKCETDLWKKLKYTGQGLCRSRQICQLF
jgi:hypothetical protein